MEKSFLDLKAKIDIFREEHSHKKRIHYPKFLRAEILSFLNKEGMSVYEFCRKAGFSLSTVNRWKKTSFAKESSSKILNKESSFKPVAIKRAEKKDLYILKDLSLEEICDLLGGL